MQDDDVFELGTVLPYLLIKTQNRKTNINKVVHVDYSVDVRSLSTILAVLYQVRTERVYNTNIVALTPASSSEQTSGLLTCSFL